MEMKKLYFFSVLIGLGLTQVPSAALASNFYGAVGVIQPIKNQYILFEKMDNKPVITSTVGFELGAGFSVEGQVQYPVKSTTAIGEGGSYFESRISSYNAYIAHRYLINDHIYLKSRVGVAHQELKYSYYGENSKLNNSNVFLATGTESATAFSGGAGLGLRVSNKTNVELTYEYSSPIELATRNQDLTLSNGIALSVFFSF